MFTKQKYILIALIFLFQIIGFALLFVNLTLGLIVYLLHIGFLINLIAIFIKERRVERKEKSDYDDSDY